MSQSGPPLESLPYYREYLEQILRPRVVKLVEEARSRLGEQVWAELVERMAEDQGAGARDEQSLRKLRALLSEQLGLKIDVRLDAAFNGAGPVAGGFGGSAAPSSSHSPVTTSDGHEVVERTFPNNPLARAVGGVRKAAQ